MIRLRPQEASRWPMIFGQLLLIATLGMTFLTFAKELVMFQNERGRSFHVIYLVATRLYYPLLLLNLLMLAGFAIFNLKRRHSAPLLGIAFAVFALNVALFSANNIVNFIRGKPLHRVHQGIGW